MSGKGKPNIKQGAIVQFNRPISRKDMLKVAYWSLCSAVTKKPLHVNMIGATIEYRPRFEDYAKR